MHSVLLLISEIKICWYQTHNEGIYPLFDCARPGRWVTKVERHTFQLPVTYHTDFISQAMLLVEVTDRT